jgi:hypothetical protein
MTVTINNPRGMDYFIDKLQAWLQAELFALWAINPADDAASAKYIFYPRIHRTQEATTGGYIAEVYKGNGEYEEVYWNDTLTGLSWFGTGQRMTRDVQEEIDIHLVTFANLKKLYPLISHRADNEIRLDFQKVLSSPLFGFRLESTEIGLANVLREYPGSRRDNRLLAADMGDVHAFRLNLKLVFNPSEAC